MEYHRAQLKRFSKAAMRETRPRAWAITLLYLFLLLLVSGVLTFLSPDPLEPLTEQFDGVAESVAIFALEADDPEEILLYLEDELEDRLAELVMDYAEDVNIRPSQSTEEVFLGFFLYLLFKSIPLTLIAALLSILATIINTVFGYGYQNYCLGVFRQQNPSAGRIFSAFPRILTVIGASFMVGLFTFLWSLLVTVIGAAAIALLAVLIQSEAAIFPIVAIYLVMLVFHAIIPLRYALTPYIVVEDRTVGVFDAINRSKQLMKRRKLKLFVLQLSFLGWYLLLSFLAVAIFLVGVLVSALVFSLTQEFLLMIAIMGGTALVTIIAPLPLSIWLMIYEGVSFAGFYHVASFVEPAQVAVPVPAPEIPVPVAAAPVGAAPVEFPAQPPMQPAPVAEMPVEPPVQPAPAEPAPVVEAPVEAAPVVEAPVEVPVEVPVESAPVVEAPAEVPVEPAPVVETPVETPAEPAPVVETPVEAPVEVPVEPAPVVEAPVEFPEEEPTIVVGSPMKRPAEPAPVEEIPVEEFTELAEFIEEAPEKDPAE